MALVKIKILSGTVIRGGELAEAGDVLEVDEGIYRMLKHSGRAVLHRDPQVETRDPEVESSGAITQPTKRR